MSDENSTRFMEMLTAHQRDLYSYVSVLLAGDAAAQDVVQETNVALWSNRERFDFERPFMPWALKFAYNMVLAHRKSRGRSRLVFSDEFVEALSDDFNADLAPADERLAALRECLQRLPKSQRQLLSERYQGTLSVKVIASRAGSTANQVSAQLYRIRKALAKCIELNLPRVQGRVADGGATP